MLAAAATKLLELQAAGGRLLVLRRRVVPLLALGALQCYDFPHPAILTDPALHFPVRRILSISSFQLSDVSFSNP